MNTAAIILGIVGIVGSVFSLLTRTKTLRMRKELANETRKLQMELGDALNSGDMDRVALCNERLRWLKKVYGVSAGKLEARGSDGRPIL